MGTEPAAKFRDAASLRHSLARPSLRGAGAAASKFCPFNASLREWCRGGDAAGIGTVSRVACPHGLRAIVNTPPAKAGGFRLRLKAGLAGHDMRPAILLTYVNRHFCRTNPISPRGVGFTDPLSRQKLHRSLTLTGSCPAHPTPRKARNLPDRSCAA